LRGALWVSSFPICGESFQPADGYGFFDALKAQAHCAFELALFLLGTDASAYCGEGVGFFYDSNGGSEVAPLNFRDESGYLHAHGATVHARGVFAVEAPFRLERGLLFGKSKRDLVHVPQAGVRGLGPHFLRWDSKSFFYRHEDIISNMEPYGKREWGVFLRRIGEFRNHSLVFLFSLC
jgi:hypothetical protein